MFTHHQIAHFRAFGFVLAPALFRPDEVDELRAEVTSALTDAYGGLGVDHDPHGMGGIRGDYLPLSVDRAPRSQSFIADDPRLFQGAASLLGESPVPTIPIATCFTTNGGWHTDDDSDLPGVKFLAHLEPRTAGTGALRVLPGSHLPGYQAELQKYWREDPARQGFPGWSTPFVALETEPGDVIAFDVHLFHSSAGGSDRLAWTIEYRPWPGLGDADAIAAVRDTVVEVVDFDHKGYDRGRWPTWREWVAGAGPIPSRRAAVERLRLLGVIGEDEPR